MWQKITDADAREARILELMEPKRRNVPVPPQKIWRCTACIDLAGDPGIMTKAEITYHYSTVYVVISSSLTLIAETYTSPHAQVPEDIEEGKDYYRTLECPPKQPLVIKMIPKEITSS